MSGHRDAFSEYVEKHLFAIADEYVSAIHRGDDPEKALAQLRHSLGACVGAFCTAAHSLAPELPHTFDSWIGSLAGGLINTAAKLASVSA